jgi:hypothetical protein
MGCPTARRDVCGVAAFPFRNKDIPKTNSATIATPPAIAKERGPSKREPALESFENEFACE